MKKITAILLLLFMTVCSSNVLAQTTYKSDSGFFTPILESFYLRGGNFEDAKLVGPAVGYRFNETYDLTIHTEFLFSKYKFNNTTNPESTLLNLGVILGRTDNLSQKLLLRSESSFFQTIILNTEDYDKVSKPSLTSGVISSSLYREFYLSNSVVLLPNAGIFLGYGNYTAPYSSANLRQGFDDFIVGPRFGFDVSFEMSDLFYLVVNPEISIPLNSDSEDSEAALLFNVQLNF